MKLTLCIVMLSFASFFSFFKNPFAFLQTLRQTSPVSTQVERIRLENFDSKHLGRKVTVDIFLPPSYHRRKLRYGTLYFNDGQDMEGVKLKATLEKLYDSRQMSEIIVVAAHANPDRMQEYGTAAMPDFAGRGNKAAAHSRFITEELIPYIRKNYRVYEQPEHTAIAGFSLGGLSAFDIGWAHPEIFGKTGVFSGSFWWRKKDFKDGYTDENDRIMQYLVRNDSYKKGLKMWFEAGTADETSDRNNNGIIDAIEDTLDLMKELADKGYHNGRDMKYVEIKDGRHDLETWAECMPEFLTWAFGK